jgi:hypothetical protein
MRASAHRPLCRAQVWSGHARTRAPAACRRRGLQAVAAACKVATASLCITRCCAPVTMLLDYRRPFTRRCSKCKCTTSSRRGRRSLRPSTRPSTAVPPSPPAGCSAYTMTAVPTSSTWLPELASGTIRSRSQRCRLPPCSSLACRLSLPLLIPHRCRSRSTRPLHRHAPRASSLAQHHPKWSPGGSYSSQCRRALKPFTSMIRRVRFDEVDCLRVCIISARGLMKKGGKRAYLIHYVCVSCTAQA